jgi:hypothetical protein
MHTKTNRQECSAVLRNVDGVLAGKTGVVIVYIPL